MSKRQLETKCFEIGPLFSTGDRRSSLAPFSLNGALRYVNVRPLKKLFLSLTGSDCTNKSLTTLLHQTQEINETLFFTVSCLLLCVFQSEEMLRIPQGIRATSMYIMSTKSK